VRLRLRQILRQRQRLVLELGQGHYIHHLGLNMKKKVGVELLLYILQHLSQQLELLFQQLPNYNIVVHSRLRLVEQES
jgi:hypothetical protein